MQGNPTVPALDLVIRAGRAVTASGEGSCSVGVRDGRIVAVEPVLEDLDGRHVVDLPDDVVLIPGLVDTHVHINEPGRTEWEGFAAATSAAAAGGVTTIVDMPLNSMPPTVDVEALTVKRRAAAGNCFVDVGFWAGLVPGNRSSLRALHEAGVFGFKCFLVPSGVDEFPPLSPSDLEGFLAELAGLGALTLVHAEDAKMIENASTAPCRSYRDFLRSRPRAAENVAVAGVIEAADRTGARVHVVHLSSAEAAPIIRTAREQGIQVSAETCPHYLTFAADQIANGDTLFKCCPPIREADNREALWAALSAGTITAVVSDHCPCPADLKAVGTGDFDLAWGGISSLQVCLSAVWSEARRRRHSLVDVVNWMAAGPAELAGLRRKGRIAPGYDADLVAFSPDEEFVVDPASLRHRHATTPYAGRTLTGVVRTTWLRGVPVNDDVPRGRLLTRGAA
jgi:allantoinase